MSRLLDELVDTYEPTTEEKLYQEYADVKSLCRELTSIRRELEQLQTTVALLVELNPDIALPEKCRKRNCSYHTHYLQYGGPDLSHEQYHQTEQYHLAHLEACKWDWTRGACPTCLSHERATRA